MPKNLLIHPKIFLVLLGLLSSVLGCLKNPVKVESSLSQTSETPAQFTFEGASSAVNLSDSRIQLQWTKSSDAALVTYRIYLLQSDGSLKAIGAVPRTLSQYIVSDLTSGTYYSFLVRGVDSEGNTDLNTHFVSALTYGGISEATVQSATSAKVKFPAAPDANQLNIYCATGTSTNFILMASVESTLSEYTLNALTSSTLYRCKVKALGPDNLEDSNSLIVSFIPSSTPGGLDLTFSGIASATSITASQIRLNWVLGTGTQIAGYRVSEVGLDGVTLIPVGTLPSSSQTFLVSGLTSGSFHTYVVQALSSTGVSDGNTIKASATAYAGVSQAVVTSSSTATLTLPLVLSAQSVNVYCKSGSGDYPSSPTTSVLGVVTSVYLTGLSAGVSYTCKSLVVNQNGVEEINEVAVSFTPPDLTFSGATQALVLNSSQVQISWSLGTGSSISNYRIYELGSDGVTKTVVTTVSSASQSYTISGVSQAAHSYLVKAISASGFEDTNTIVLGAFPYGGITASSILNSSSVNLSFPSATGATYINIFCKTSSGTYPSSPNSQVSSSQTSANVAGLIDGNTYTCKAEPQINGVSYPNSPIVSFYLPILTFSGADQAVGVTGSQIRISWIAGTGSEISNYRVYEVSSDGLSRTLLTTLPFTSLSYTVGSLSSMIHYFVVKAVSASGVEDPNAARVQNIPYAGISLVTPVDTSSVTVYFPSSAGADSLQIFCKKTRDLAYNSSPDLEVLPTASSATLSLTSGRSHVCKVNAVVNSVRYSNLATYSFQTLSNSASKYNGVILAAAYGAAPTAPSGPTNNQAIISFKYFGSSSSTSQSYSVVRTLKGAALDATSVTSCTVTKTDSCRVCLFTNVTNSQTCIDTNVDASPIQYDYAITLMAADGVAEELPVTGDSGYRITVPIPPANMVLVQRDAANYEMCTLMGRATDPLNHQRCSYSGLGAVPTNSGPGKPALGLPAGYYDFGYNLFVDRWEVACNWKTTGTALPSGGVSGDVYYRSSDGNCHINNGGTWTTVNNGSLGAGALRAAAYTIAPSSTNRRPPMVQLDQGSANNTCKSISDSTYGTKRLLRKREFNVAAAWSTVSGAYGAMTEVEAAAMEAGSDHSTAAGTFRCNSDTRAGVTAAVFNSTSYELSRDSAGGPDSFTIGSVGTKNCVSRFGAQDMVGNVFELISDQISCVGSYNCNGITSALDSGNTDLNNFSFNGTQGPGGGTSSLLEYTLETIPVTLGSVTYSSMYFSAPLGLPLVNSDSGNALQIGTAINSTKLHGDTISLYFGNTTETRGLYAGGSWQRGTSAGRWEAGLKNPTNVAGNTIGFRCALPAE